MKNLLIIYYSAVGNTKSTAAIMHNKIKQYFNVDFISAENLPSDFDINKYSAIIIGFPTFHSEPAKPIMNWLVNIYPCRKIPAFVFTTCGLFSENSLRIFSKNCLKHNIIPIQNSSYRCAATDGILLTPFINVWFKSEKHLSDRIVDDCMIFMQRLKNHASSDIPKAKWYTMLNYPNKIMGKHTVLPIYLHENKCIKCNKCFSRCSVNAITLNDNNYPEIDKSRCINCYRCIHHCPAKALSLSRKRCVSKVWKNSI